MSSERRAVIDVGTNSVKLLVAELTPGGELIPLDEKSEQTRLGRGFYETHVLLPEAIAQTARAVADFATRAAEWNVSSIRVLATSAARDARNQQELLSGIERTSGLQVEVLSGAQEADYAFRGVTSDPVFLGKPLLILDVGGGSSEFILGEGVDKVFRESYPLGSVRLLEQLQPADPPTALDWQRCRARIQEQVTTLIAPALEAGLRNYAGRPVQLVGTGGAITILARLKLALPKFVRELIEGETLALEEIRGQRERLWNVPLDERKQIVGLPPKRADVILMGAAIYEILMVALGFTSVRVSTRGLRYGALLK
ncbi:MAG: Ppx/GppA family phosphatase [Verrucomicrobiota bacterium]